MKKLRKFIILIMMINVMINVASGALPNIVAVVNDEPITWYEFTARKQMLVKLNDIKNLDANTSEQFSILAMNSLIDDSILKQHAMQVGGEITDAEIEAAITSIEQKNNMTPGHLLKSFADQDLANSFKAQVTSELIKMNIISYLAKSVTVSPKEIDMLILTTNAKDVKVAAQIYTSKEKNNKALAKMNNLRHSLGNCHDVDKRCYEKFADVKAIQENLSTLDPQLQTIIKDLNVKQASQVIDTHEGFKVILLCHKEFYNITSEENNYITDFLINKKVAQKAQKFLDTLRKKSYIKVMLP